MITNLPTSTEFEDVAKQCLIQAFNIVYEIDKDLIYIEEVPDKDVWEYHLGDLSTSLILVYQAIEAFTKASICKESPLLLIDLNRIDWPTLPNSKDKDFNELFTISGESLIRTYCSVVSADKVNTELIDFIEEIRLARNKIIHGVSRDYLDPENIIVSILKTYTFFNGKDSWWLSMRELHINNPLFGVFNNNFEEALLIEKLDYVEELLVSSEFRNHFSLNLKSRRYYCPWCKTSLSLEGEDLNSKWAFLVPQKEIGVTEILCINCQRTHNVIRKNCYCDDCKGNVLFNNGEFIECLSCGVEQ